MSFNGINLFGSAGYPSIPATGEGSAEPSIISNLFQQTKAAALGALGGVAVKLVLKKNGIDLPISTTTFAKTGALVATCLSSATQLAEAHRKYQRAVQELRDKKQLADKVYRKYQGIVQERANNNYKAQLEELLEEIKDLPDIKFSNDLNSDFIQNDMDASWNQLQKTEFQEQLEQIERDFSEIKGVLEYKSNELKELVGALENKISEQKARIPHQEQCEFSLDTFDLEETN